MKKCEGPHAADHYSPSAPTAKFLTESDLAARWVVSPKVLRNKRWAGGGPPFVKIGGSIRYRLADIEAYEAARTFNSTTAASNAK